MAINGYGGPATLKHSRGGGLNGEETEELMGEMNPGF
jgi:hypothetical protein